MRMVSIVAVAVVTALLGILWYQTANKDADDQFAQCRATSIASGAGTIGGPFTLVDETGKTVTDKDVITGPTLVYFGYTFCPDVCPLDNARNAEAVELLEKMGKIVKPVFISIDPERDTPQAMAEFTDYLHPRMLGLTGTPEQSKAASKAYHTYFKKEEDGDPEYYLVDHSTQTYLMFPEHGFVDFFRRDETAEDMAKRVACFVDAAS
ncbi:SCO family protein [Profundibacter sp.]